MASAPPAPPLHNFAVDKHHPRRSVESPPRDFSHHASPTPLPKRSTIAGNSASASVNRQSKLDNILNPDKNSQTKSTSEDVEPPSIKKSKILIKIPCSGIREEEIPIPILPPDNEPKGIDKTKVWNLRLRKSRPVAADAGGSDTTEKNKAEPKSGENGKKTKKKKLRLCISLSKEEIEEDIFSLVGSKPSRRPKKRPRNVQSQLDNLFPGLWLGSISAESYRVSKKSMKD